MRRFNNFAQNNSPMIIDGISADDRSKELRKMPWSEAKPICIAERRCFYCKIQGHGAEACPVKAPNKAGYQPYSITVSSVVLE